VTGALTRTSLTSSRCWALPQFQPGRGEGDPLDPPVRRVALAGRQSPLLQLVGDAGDEGRVAAHPQPKILHRQWAVQPVQRLEEEDRHAVPLGDFLRPREHRSEQFGHAVEDLRVEPVSGAVPGCHQHPPCPDAYILESLNS
jgi:hypothetical protein